MSEQQPEADVNADAWVAGKSAATWVPDMAEEYEREMEAGS